MYTLTMKARIALALLTAITAAPLIAHADGASFRTAGGSLYATGPVITVTEAVPNDVVAAGGTVDITGNAGNDVLAAGGTVKLSGNAGGDARLAGGTVIIAGSVGADAVLAGGTLRLLPGAVVACDLIAASGDITIEGTVGGNARIIGRSVTINGTITRDADIKAEHLIIGSKAVIKGDLRYAAPEKARMEPGAVVTGRQLFTRTEIEKPREALTGLLLLWWVVKLIATAAAALVLFFALREKTMEVTALAVNRFGRELLTGFIVLITVPAAALLLIMTVIGWLLGVLAMFFYIAFVGLSTVLGALVFTRLASGYVFKEETSLAWPVILLGILIYHVIGLIPFLGWIFTFVFFLAGLGSLVHLVYLTAGEKTYALRR